MTARAKLLSLVHEKSWTISQVRVVANRTLPLFEWIVEELLFQFLAHIIVAFYADHRFVVKPQESTYVRCVRIVAGRAATVSDRPVDVPSLKGALAFRVTLVTEVRSASRKNKSLGESMALVTRPAVFFGHRSMNHLLLEAFLGVLMTIVAFLTPGRRTAKEGQQ
jgi:hypothetical protein